MDGIINVYKERGFTSHDVVAKLRGILHQKKIGHTGTLDPEAEGVLPVCLGKATKVCDLLTDWDKEYSATLLLGITTDTQDMTGTVLKECPVFLHDADGFQKADIIYEAGSFHEAGSLSEDCNLTEDNIRSYISSFIGEIEQIPPMYSALKVDGKKLYELARQGIEVERKPRRIRIADIQINKICENMLSLSAENVSELPVIEVQMTVKCSKGTYIRTLCNDIGEKLGCGGCMSSLLRTEVGLFKLSDTWRLSEIEELHDENRLEECLYPTDSVFVKLKAVQLTPEAERLVRNGNPLSPGMMAGCRELADMDERLADCSSWEYKNWRSIETHEKMIAIQQGESRGIPLTTTLRSWKSDPTLLRLYGQSMTFLAVYEYNEEKHSWRARKMFL